MTVVNGGDRSQKVAGAKAYVYSKEMQLVEVGSTDEFGEVRLSKSRIAASPVPVLLVCKPPLSAFGCAAAPLEMTRLLEFDEYSITLPPVVVYWSAAARGPVVTKVEAS